MEWKKGHSNRHLHLKTDGHNNFRTVKLADAKLKFSLLTLAQAILQTAADSKNCIAKGLHNF